ncbi:CLUMA_CG013103, isoform A [Clunio marinus]|uniref:CLUMA_CG013103, isoform A n=1 Tax=Clunio marinus TaxID=568069 RepID=A0A1J1IHV4_9DIPT|nr:CLUMA_CG013103, isoform A [Clunio marinus]
METEMEKVDEVSEDLQIREKWYQKISVEPSLFLYMMAFMVTSVVENVFFVYKACTVNHGHPHNICINIENYNETKKEVQVTTADFFQWNSIAGHVIPIILALFLGAFSDKRGRKLTLLMGLFGKFIYSVMVVVNTLQPTWPVEYVIYTATIPSAFTGADVAIFASAFAYISDITSVQDRTLRITILDVCYLSTMPTGVALGTYLFNYFNKSFTIMFVINASLLFLGIVYTLLNLKWQTTPKQQPLTDLPWTKWIPDFFDKKHFMSSMKTLCKRRNNNYRTYIIFMMISMAFYAFQRDEKPYLYLYTQLQFNWTTEIYSNFKTYQSAAFVLVMLIAVPIMNKLLKWKDTTIVIIGASAHSLGRVCFGLATASWMMFLGATIAALGPTVAPALRSITSKLVPVEERGSVFALLSVCDNAVPLLNGVMYTQVYKWTIDSHPAGIFWLTLATQMIVLVLVLHIHLRKPFDDPNQTNGRKLIEESTERK